MYFVKVDVFVVNSFCYVRMIPAERHQILPTVRCALVNGVPSMQSRVQACWMRRSTRYLAKWARDRYIAEDAAQEREQAGTDKEACKARRGSRDNYEQDIIMTRTNDLEGCMQSLG